MMGATPPTAAQEDEGGFPSPDVKLLPSQTVCEKQSFPFQMRRYKLTFLRYHADRF
jgi:hypothetical protein